MSLFDTELYPTPDHIITKMMEAYVKSYKHHKWDFEESYLAGGVKTFLDPQGGTGAILDHVHDHYLKRERTKMFTIEINPDLRHILLGKGYKVIGTDFLEFDEPTGFDMIVQNPPFSDGWKHALKGYEMLNDGGRMTCLLNAQTLRNPDNKDKAILLNLLGGFIGASFRFGDDPTELLSELEETGAIEWLGACFAGGERATLAEVVMIRVTKPVKPISFVMDGDRFDKDAPMDSEAYAANPLAHADAIKNLVARYNTASAILVERHETQSKLDFFMQGIESPVMSSTGRDATESFAQEVQMQDQIACLKSRFWSTVFRRTKIGSKLTSNYRRKFDEIAIHQTNMSFNERNIQELLLGFFANRGDIMMECIGDVFDEATKHHKDNQVHNEGWKTNSGYRLGKRIIMPYGVSFTYGSFNIHHGNTSDFLDDLDKIMCYLGGYEYSNIQSLTSALREAIRCGCWQRPFESSFFKFRFYKKGTLHIDFLDLELLEDFNVMACQFKKWLPADFSYRTRRDRKAAPQPVEDPNPQPVTLSLPPALELEDEPLSPAPSDVPAWTEINRQTCLLKPERVEKTGQLCLL